MKPPTHLSKETREWWRKIEKSWTLDDAAYILLKTALEAYDEMHQAKAILKKEGVTIKTKTNIKKHPALEMLKVARSQFLASWRMLNFGIEPPGEIGRPPGDRREREK